MDIIELFGNLPGSLDIEGVNFQLKLIVNGMHDDIRLVYDLCSCSEESAHWENYTKYGCWKNPLADGATQGFAFLREGIADQWDLAAAIKDAENFVLDVGIYTIKIKENDSSGINRQAEGDATRHAGPGGRVRRRFR